MKNNTQLNILAVGYETSIMKVVERLLNSHDGWHGTIAITPGDGLEKINSEKYDAILLCVGVTGADEAEIRRAAASKDPSTKVIRHYGGGSGLLENELRTALDHNNF